MAKNVEDLNKTACLSPAAARRQGCRGEPRPAGDGEDRKRGLPSAPLPFESVLKCTPGATVLCPATLGSFWVQGTEVPLDL